MSLERRAKSKALIAIAKSSNSKKSLVQKSLRPSHVQEPEAVAGRNYSFVADKEAPGSPQLVIENLKSVILENLLLDLNESGSISNSSSSEAEFHLQSSVMELAARWNNLFGRADVTKVKDLMLGGIYLEL